MNLRAFSVRSRALVVLLLLAFTVAACQTTTTTPAPATAAPATAAPATAAPATAAPATAAPIPSGGQAVKGGTYTIAYPSPGRAWTVGPFWEGSGTQFMQYYLLYDQLVKLSVDLTTWLPNLAESWTLSPDGKTLEFKLRQGVVWHDGQPFTADDVAYTYRAQLMITDAYIDDPLLTLIKGAKAFREGTSEELGVTAVDASTVRFDFEAASPLYMEIIMQRPILPKHVWEGIVTRTTTLADIGNVEPTTQGIGTGPFKVGSYDSETVAEYVKNADYFAGEPNLDRVIFRFVVEETTIAAGVEAGEIDGAAIWDTSTYPRLKTVPTLTQTIEPAVTGSYAIMPNFRKSGTPFADVKFRQAVSYAIPRQQIAEQFFQGVAQPTSTLIYNPAYLADLQLTDYSFNPDRAKELLAEINYDTNQELIFLFQAGDEGPELAAIQQALGDVGIKIKFEQLADNAGLEERFKDPESWHMYIEYWSHGTDPSSEFQSLVICPEPYDPCGHAGFNWTPPARFKELLASQQSELDPAKRKAMFQEMIMIVDQEQPTIQLFTEPNVYFVNKRVHGSLPIPPIYRYGVWAFNQVDAHTWWVDPA